MKLMVFPPTMAVKGQFEVFDDFGNYTDGELWTKGGTTETVGVVASTAGGILSIATDVTANHTGFVASTNANFQLLAGRNWYCEFFAQYTEANTNAAGIAVGLSSVTTALLVATTAIPASSFTGALIYKPAAQTTWNAVSSNGTTQTITAGQQSSQPSSSAYQALRIEGRDVDGSNYEVTFFVNNEPLLDTTAFHRPIKQTVAISGAAAMKLVMFVIGTAGTNAETLLVDYAVGLQRRY